MHPLHGRAWTLNLSRNMAQHLTQEHQKVRVLFPVNRGPKGHRNRSNTKMSLPGPKAHHKGDTRIHVDQDPYVPNHPEVDRIWGISARY